MSKQICFFTTQKDIDLLISLIYSLGAIIIDYTGKTLTKQVLSNIADYDHQQKNLHYNNVLITKPNFTLAYKMSSKGMVVDKCVSEVIEFSFCSPVPRTIIDTSSVDEEFRKEGIIVIDDTERYHRLMKALMDNPPYIENPIYIENGFECGRFWYAASFYDTDGNLNPKSKEVDTLFRGLKNHIRKNFLLSKDKSYYIAPDAYEKYLLGFYVPCSGKYRIVF